MYDPSTAYRSTQITSSSPAARVVLLYQGAIRFGTQHLSALGRGDLEAAHVASIRCQAIVAALQETLDLAAGPIARQLDELYTFVLGRLVEGNIGKTPRPTEEALEVLRGLLDAWQEVSRTPASAPSPGHEAPPAGAVLRGGVVASPPLAGAHR